MTTSTPSLPPPRGEISTYFFPCLFACNHFLRARDRLAPQRSGGRDYGAIKRGREGGRKEGGRVGSEGSRTWGWFLYYVHIGRGEGVTQKSQQNCLNCQVTRKSSTNCKVIADIWIQPGTKIVPLAHCTQSAPLRKGIRLEAGCFTTNLVRNMIQTRAHRYPRPDQP